MTDLVTAHDALTAMLPQLSRDVPRRRVATWHRVDDGIRVTVTVWGRRDVMAQTGWTVGTLGDAWQVAAATGCVDSHRASHRGTFLTWCGLGRR